MDLTASITDFFGGGDQAVLPHLSVDCAVFGFHGRELKVLLGRMRNADRWTLPGGYVLRDESLDAAAARVLCERTGLERVFLQQFHAFGDTDRGEAMVQEVLAGMGVDVPSGHWITQRHVTIGYLALVDFAEVRPSPSRNDSARSTGHPDGAPGARPA